MQEDPNFHQSIYRANGKLLKLVIQVWIGLMIGISLVETFAPTGQLDAMDMLKVKFIVIAMCGVTLMGALPWLLNPKGTWQMARAEPGNLQGICNRCAAFLPLVGLVVLIFAAVFWEFYF